MAENTSTSSGARFRKIIERIDDKEGEGRQENAAVPAPSAASAILDATPETSNTPEKVGMTLTATPAKAAAPLEKDKVRKRRWFQHESFQNFAILFSLAINLVLVVVVIILGLSVFELKRAIAGPLIGGLHDSFVQMDKAHIKTTIPVNTTIEVNDTIPVEFDLPLKTNTNVVLTQNTLIPNTAIVLNGVSLPVDITLPAGTPLNINLDLIVPVRQMLPVKLIVPVHIPVAVDIPLEQTDLHQPFADLRDLLAPYNDIVQKVPDSWWGLITGDK